MSNVRTTRDEYGRFAPERKRERGGRRGTGARGAAGGEGREGGLDEKRAVNVGQTERLVSAVAAGALMMNFLRRPSLTSFMLAAGGGGLIHRAATGRCAVYSAMGIDTSTGGGGGGGGGGGARARLGRGGTSDRASQRKDVVDEASEESFPASDPPGWGSSRS